MCAYVEFVRRFVGTGSNVPVVLLVCSFAEMARRLACSHAMHACGGRTGPWGHAGQASSHLGGFVGAMQEERIRMDLEAAGVKAAE